MFLIDLDDTRATDVELVGAKVAALAQARHDGTPTHPGRVLTTAVSDLYDAGTTVAEPPGLDGVPSEHPLVVRSSSVAEDLAESSSAGQLDSVVGVQGFEHFHEAVRTVINSRERAGVENQPMGVLVHSEVVQEPIIAATDNTDTAAESTLPAKFNPRRFGGTGEGRSF